jgi:hypothetical protein
MAFLASGALGVINWALILKEAPKIVREARQVYELVSRRRAEAQFRARLDPADLPAVPDALNELRYRVDEMEAHNARQAELISQLAAQGEALSEALEATAGRLGLMMWVAGGAVLVAAASLAVALLN